MTSGTNSPIQKNTYQNVVRKVFRIVLGVFFTQNMRNKEVRMMTCFSIKGWVSAEVTRTRDGHTWDSDIPM